MDLLEEGGTASAEFALAALLEFGLKSLKGLDGRPARVEVRDPGLRDALAEAIGRMSTSVVVVDDLPTVREVLNNLEAEAAGGRRFPGLLESSGVTPDRLRAFAQAAAAFYTARPWEHLANEDLIGVESDGAPRAMRHVRASACRPSKIDFSEAGAQYAPHVHSPDAGRAVG
ncbi:MAG TPA: hypothetical protein VGL62_06015 [Vicinamibacterales bacterium]|jgi:hypothetical protein